MGLELLESVAGCAGGLLEFDRGGVGDDEPAELGGERDGRFEDVAVVVVVRVGMADDEGCAVAFEESRPPCGGGAGQEGEEKIERMGPP